jgi:RNA polymerase sigma-70 factor (ECF subfamily)
VPLEGLADPPTDEASPEDAAVDRESVRLVGEAIEGLPPDYQAVLKLRDLDGLDTQEACAQLGLSPEALKSRLHRARAALAERLLVLLKPARPGQG